MPILTHEALTMELLKSIGISCNFLESADNLGTIVV